MAEWLFWWTLAAMLWTGYHFGTGVFLLQFSLAAVGAGVVALVPFGDLQWQLHFFLFLACLQMLLARRSRASKPPSSR